jgi:hypothetical protein
MRVSAGNARSQVLSEKDHKLVEKKPPRKENIPGRLQSQIRVEIL